MHLDDVGVTQGFQDLRLDEDGIDIADGSNILSFDDLYSEELVRLFMSREIHLPETSLPEQLHHLVLCETTGWVELIPLRRIKHRSILHVIQVILEAFRSIRVEQPQLIVFE